MAVIEGVDYSSARPSPAGLAQAGKRFAVRYGGPGSAPKHLTAPELRALRAAGLDVVANAEGSAGGYRGTAAGRDWATSAERDFRALGMGADRPIYFSVDWDAGPADWPEIDAALRGSASVIGAARVGVYGSFDVVEHCHAARTAAWFWQTYAWSGGRQHPSDHLYQYHNGVTLAGGSVDLTRALQADYGQWGATTTGGDVNLDDKLGNSGPTVGVALQEGYRRSGHAADNSDATLAKLDALSAKVDSLVAGVAITPEVVAEAFRILAARA